MVGIDRWGQIVCNGPNVLVQNACANNLDDDGDGAVDDADSDCFGGVDISEWPLPECVDGGDNDGDGLIDYDDLECAGPTDDAEAS